VNVAVVPLSDTAPAIPETWKDEAFTDVESTASLKVTDIAEFTATPVAPLAGLVWLTVGLVVSVPEEPEPAFVPPPPPPPDPHAEKRIITASIANALNRFIFNPSLFKTLPASLNYKKLDSRLSHAGMTVDLQESQKYPLFCEFI